VGAHTPQGMSLDALLELIRGAGKIPAERDSFYNVLRTFGDDRGQTADGSEMRDAGPGRDAGPSSFQLPTSPSSSEAA
jgi:aminodeoxyfutalosine synthase